METTTQRWCVWSGIAFLVVFGVGFWGIAGFIPPPSPTESAQEVAQFYVDNTIRIRTGMAVTLLGVTFLFPWVAVISVQLKRVEGRSAPMSYSQLMAGGISVLTFLFPVFVWQTAAYRPGDRSPDTIKLLNDLGWLPFVGIATPAIMQCVAIGVVTLRDSSTSPVFPRWLGYFNLWAAVTFLPAAVLPFFKGGPFAWNGILSLYFPLTVFGAWFAVMAWALLRAIDQQQKTFDVSPATVETRAG